MSETLEAGSVSVAESGLGPYGQIVIAGRHVLGADEPERLGGRDTGPDPFEHVMAGLGACTVMTIRMYAARKNWSLAHVAVKLKHSKPAPLGHHKFMREITLEGTLDEAQRARLLEVAEHCPVHKMLLEGAVIETTQHKAT